MWDKDKIPFFRKKLLKWFEINKREFPWRKNNLSNYELIFSEILLQRTKAETVSNYYPIFFGKYPNWGSIIDAGIQDLEMILKPLGLFKHRAKRLYKIIQEYKTKNGELPVNKNQLQDSSLATLYISNAYELFVLNHRSALLDVNMSRVLGRFFNIPEKKDVRKNSSMQELAQAVINIKQCKDLNWAVLDFAALVCRSSKPKCTVCVLNAKCGYFMLTHNEDNMN